MSTSEFLEADTYITDAENILKVGEFKSNTTNPIILTLDQWVEERTQPGAKDKPSGVILKNTDALEPLLPELAELQLICIEFPDAVDGRGYTQASLLRNRHGYNNELRAVGEVLVDQLFLLRRCGFDSFALKSGQTMSCDLNYLQPFTVTYQ